ncbi:tRNA uridine-5-carboxymethylaminomethyl(34) synthesis GTPase MnmE [Faunimonas sp. B44]|uniref:tRNA uridine-5-carboxymethylaminomethyl(34) synthesis GTPase MnmE n=1 Tax=Faunimonas sp. B44 TaxID=3461493 RepID=UPI00404472C6
METIYALSSGPPPAGVAVVRISGAAVREIAGAMLGGLPPARAAALRTIRHPATGETIDRGLAIYMPAPGTFTGEDVLELQSHGGTAVVRAILDALAGLPGVRMAAPGAFTRRAFDNGRLDLVEVEALADLIAAETEAQRRQAVRGSHLAARAEAWRSMLIAARAEIEARLDFSDEAEVGEVVPQPVLESAEAIRREASDILARSAAAERIRSGYRVALAGRPNAGKSTLLNALAHRDVAIVTAEPGTTRDVLEVPLDLGGYPVLVYDTAGMRDAGSLAEQAGVARARRTIEQADLVLWLTEPGGAKPDLRPPDSPNLWRVATKADLLRPQDDGAGADFVISAQTGQGVAGLIEALQREIAEALGGAGAGAVAARERQKRALSDLVQALDLRAGEPDEVTADRLRQATDVIGRLTGRVDIEDVLDHLFGEFCIGK